MKEGAPVPLAGVPSISTEKGRSCPFAGVVSISAQHGLVPGGSTEMDQHPLLVGLLVFWSQWVPNASSWPCRFHCLASVQRSAFSKASMQAGGSITLQLCVSE